MDAGGLLSYSGFPGLANLLGIPSSMCRIQILGWVVPSCLEADVKTQFLCRCVRGVSYCGTYQQRENGVFWGEGERGEGLRRGDMSIK